MENMSLDLKKGTSSSELGEKGERNGEQIAQIRNGFEGDKR